MKRSRGTSMYSRYENFAMNNGETIQEMYTRVTSLKNELKSLGRIIPKEERVEKILTRVFPITWESKITVIQELENIVTLSLDELIGNLTAYELRRQTMKWMLLRGEKGSSRSGNYNKARASEKKTNAGCYKCGKTDHMIKNCPLWEIEWKKERAE
ncbi:uncharacterized protein [Nicotiana tomentosiformis]|uniref:uncharacterized protein n=1 Tax=Nicotiana tomentosiformis TaxID=4098 RepID=UPI00388C577F